MPYIVRYTHPALGPRESSVWGSLTDAQSYASTKPEDWKAHVDFVNRTPEIFRHCGPVDDNRNPSQAINGKCFWCGKVLTVADAKEFQARTPKE